MAESAESASWTLGLDTGEISGSCESAVDALETLRSQIKGDTAELAAMQRAMKNLQGASVVNVKQFRELQNAIDSKKSSLADAQSNYLSLGGSFTQAGKSASSSGSQIEKLQAKLDSMKKKAGETGKASESSLKKFGAQAKLLPGPIGAIVDKLSNLKSMLSGGAGASMLLAAGFVALTAAVVAATLALAHYGIAQADARRSELLHIEGLTKMRNWYGLAAGNAKEMQAAIDKVSAGSAASREQVAGYSDELYRMGLRGTNLTAALEAVAIKSTVQGDAAAHAFAGWAAGAALTGQSVTRLADNVKARLGGIAQKQMESLTVQAVKQKEAFNALFNGINVDAYVKAKKTVSDLLSQSTASGRALKALLTSIVQPIVDAATRAQPLIKRFFQGMIIASLELGIAFQHVRIWFKQAFGDNDAVKGIDKTRLALDLGYLSLQLLLGLAVIAAGEFLAFAWPVLLVGAALWGLYSIVDNLYKLWNEIDWTDLGNSIWQGIVKGLEQGGAKVIGAVVDVAQNAWKSFKDELGIKSPSTVFARLGLAIPEGVGVGIASGAPDVKQSVDGLVDVPNPPSAAASPSAQPSARGGNAAPTVITIGDIHINAKDEAKGRELAIDFRRELERVLESVGLELGVAPIGEPA